MAKITVDREKGVVWALRKDGTTAELLVLDPCDASTTVAATLSFPTTWGGALEGFSLDEVGGDLYVAWGAGLYTSDDLGTLNTTTGALTWVADVSGTVDDDIDDMAFVDGVLYVRDSNSVDAAVLYTLNTSTGAATTVGTFDPGLVHPRGFATNPDDGKHYVAEADGQLYELDLATAQVAAIGSPATSPWIELEFVDTPCD